MGVELELVSVLTSVPDGCEWLALQTSLLLPCKKVQVPNHQKLVGPLSRTGFFGEQKIMLSMPEIDQRLVFQPVLPLHRTDRNRYSSV
jgi:hypothetical protein